MSEEPAWQSWMIGSGTKSTNGDVQELIRILALPLDFAQQLNPYVRPKYDELWNGLKAGEVAEE